MSELKKVCAQVLELAKSAGADDAECWAEDGKQISVNLEQNDLKGAETEDHRAVGIRVLKNSGMGFAYVNRMDTDALREAVEDAVAIAIAAPADPANGFATPSAVPEVANLYDPEIPKMTIEETIQLAKNLLDTGASDSRVSIDSGSVSLSHGSTAIMNTLGVSGETKDSGGSYGLFGMAIDGDEVSGFDYLYEGRRHRNELNPAALGEKFQERVLGLLKAKDSKAYKGNVLFSMEAFEEVFVDTILDAVDGDIVFKGRSRWQDKLGEIVAPTNFHLVDDATLAGRIGSEPFDREGNPHKPFDIIRGGALAGFMYDQKAARRAGASSTGHAQGSARSAPGIGTTNVDLLAGDISEDDLFRDLGSGLYVGRFSGNVDEVSGDFSGVAKGSFWVENGEKVFPVKETLIAGNVYSLLKNIILGDKLHENMAYRGPMALVPNVDVSSGA